MSAAYPHAVRQALRAVSADPTFYAPRQTVTQRYSHAVSHRSYRYGQSREALRPKVLTVLDLAPDQSEPAR